MDVAGFFLWYTLKVDSNFTVTIYLNLNVRENHSFCFLLRMVFLLWITQFLIGMCGKMDIDSE